MATIGYGDIVPTNIMEKSFLIIIVIFSTGVFGYYLNAIANIF